MITILVDLDFSICKATFMRKCRNLQFENVKTLEKLAQKQSLFWMFKIAFHFVIVIV